MNIKINKNDNLLCVLISTCKYKNRLKSIKDTWLKDIDHVIFSDEEDVDNNIIKVTDDDTYKSNIEKSNKSFQWIHNNNIDKKWFFFTDDDGFVNVNILREYVKNLDENNVYCFLLSYKTNPENQIFNVYGKDLVYPSGGAGLLMSKKIIDIIHNKVETINDNWSDINIGLCLQKHNIKLIHDDKFNSKNPKEYPNMTDKLKTDISFHHLSIEDQYQIYNMVTYSKSNKFKIIVTSYNNEEWTEICLSSLKNQTYLNYDVFFFDDNSSDKTSQIAKEIVKNDERFHLTFLKENHTKSKIFATFIDSYINDTDIVLFLDGDDWLSSDEVLNAINQFYEINDSWVVYGGMVVWEGNDDVKEPYPQNSEFPIQVLKQRLFRQDTWRSSHVKTMRGFIWKYIKKTEFISIQDNKFLLGADDLAFMFPALEMCPTNKLKIFNFPTYVYNATNVKRIVEHKDKRGINYEPEVRSRSKYDLLPIITSELSGGLGNQMFQIAATVSLAKKLSYKAIFDSQIHFLPLQGKNIKTYQNNIFRNVIFSSNLPIKNEYTQPGFNYVEFPDIKPFTILKGGYQSEKYLDTSIIKEIFGVSDDIKSFLNKKYGDVSNKTSIHVRRGDYLKLYPHHVFVGEDYYTKAINLMRNTDYLVFSDDIEWCRSFFKGNDFNFIQDEDYNELYLMSLCKNNIIGNSTFSWWGAWLNQHPYKQVIAPNTWFGPGYSHFDTLDLIPERWIKI